MKNYLLTGWLLCSSLLLAGCALTTADAQLRITPAPAVIPPPADKLDEAIPGELPDLLAGQRPADVVAAKQLAVAQVEVDGEFVDEKDVPQIVEDPTGKKTYTELLGEQCPRLIVDGVKVVYDAEDKWYHHIGHGAPRAFWLDFAGEWHLATSDRLATVGVKGNRDVVIVQEWDPGVQAWRDTDRKPWDPEAFGPQAKKPKEETGNAVALEGPSEATPGQLVVLDGSASKGVKHFKWIAPDGIATLGCPEMKLGFSIVEPGNYRFYLVAISADDEIVILPHDLKIVGSPTPPERDEPDVGDPIEFPPPATEPADPTTFVEALKILYKNTEDAAATINDPTTARQLAAAWGSPQVLDGVAKAASMQQAAKIVGQQFEAVLAKRTGPSLYKDWDRQFRRPLNASLDKLITDGTIRDQKDLSAVFKAIANALGK